MSPIIDSAMSADEALRQNPHSIAPRAVLASLVLLDVRYLGYDNGEHRGQIVVHERVADDVQHFFECAYEIKFPIKKVIPISAPQYGWDDERSCTDNNSAAFNYRCIAGTNELSWHAYGCAFDVNPCENIYVRYDKEGNETYRLPHDGVYDPSALGTLTAHHPLVLRMRARGWVWGGDWDKKSGRIDYQHFEKHCV